MQRFDESSAVCQIFTFKEGLLSPFAHDLRIGVESFVIEVGGGEHFISASFDARSLRVDCAVENGEERPDLLSPADRDKINNSILNEVLNPDKYPVIALVSSSVRKSDLKYVVCGALTLHGQTREISFDVRKEDGTHYVCDVGLHLPDFGIRPFSTLFGAVRIKPDILIHMRIPTDRIEEGALP
ncbi:MAG: YceI family protein [Candidatus Sulfobium sp.]